MKILLLNGPNLNLLGTREPEIYGKKTIQEILGDIREQLGSKGELVYFQSNHEGALIDRLQEADFEALVINPGAFTHYSIALADCLRNLAVPKVEVHISNIYRREDFRQKSVTAACVDGILTGFGTAGYQMAVDYLLRLPSK